MSMAGLAQIPSKGSKDESDQEKAIPAQTDTTVVETRPTFVGGAYRFVSDV